MYTYHGNWCDRRTGENEGAEKRVTFWVLIGKIKGVYLNDGVCRLVINPGDYITNEDKTVPIQIFDSTQGDRGRAQVSSAASEMIAIISIPQGWTANAVQVNSSYPMHLEVFNTRDDGTGGVAAGRLIAASVNTSGLRAFDSGKEQGAVLSDPHVVISSNKFCLDGCVDRIQHNSPTDNPAITCHYLYWVEILQDHSKLRYARTVSSCPDVNANRTRPQILEEIPVWCSSYM